MCPSTTIFIFSRISMSALVVEGAPNCVANSSEAFTTTVMSICIGERGLGAPVGYSTNYLVEG